MGVSNPRPHEREEFTIEPEEFIHRTAVVIPQLLRREVAVAPARHRSIIGDIARRLLEICREAVTLEPLRKQVARPFASDVRPTQLSYGIVAIADKDPL